MSWNGLKRKTRISWLDRRRTKKTIGGDEGLS
jgi:hypothetical protein